MHPHYGRFVLVTMCFAFFVAGWSWGRVNDAR